MERKRVKSVKTSGTFVKWFYFPSYRQELNLGIKWYFISPTVIINVLDEALTHVLTAYF